MEKINKEPTETQLGRWRIQFMNERFQIVKEFGYDLILPLGTPEDNPEEWGEFFKQEEEMIQVRGRTNGLNYGVTMFELWFEYFKKVNGTSYLEKWKTNYESKQIVFEELKNIGFEISELLNDISVEDREKMEDCLRRCIIVLNEVKNLNSEMYEELKALTLMREEYQDIVMENIFGKEVKKGKNEIVLESSNGINPKRGFFIEQYKNPKIDVSDRNPKDEPIREVNESLMEM